MSTVYKSIILSISLVVTSVCHLSAMSASLNNVSLPQWQKYSRNAGVASAMLALVGGAGSFALRKKMEQQRLRRLFNVLTILGVFGTAASGGSYTKSRKGVKTLNNLGQKPEEVSAYQYLFKKKGIEQVAKPEQVPTARDTMTQDAQKLIDQVEAELAAQQDVVSSFKEKKQIGSLLELAKTGDLSSRPGLLSDAAIVAGNALQALQELATTDSDRFRQGHVDELSQIANSSSIFNRKAAQALLILKNNPGSLTITIPELYEVSI